MFLARHTFIVFHPGAGGNFLSSLLHHLLSNQLESLRISAKGSVHELAKEKSLNREWLSFGTDTDDWKLFNSQAERELFYVEKIKETTTDTRQVTYTHDFTNIPLYRKYFPNSKVIVITQDSVEEKLSVILQNITKTIMNDSPDVPLTENNWHKKILLWKTYASMLMQNAFGLDKDLAHKIVEDRLNDNWNKISLYTTILMVQKRFKLLQHDAGDVLNFVSKISDSAEEPFELIAPYSNYIDNQCILLPFSYVKDGNVGLLEQVVEAAYGHLSQEESKYIRTMFNEYVTKQNRMILSDPARYINETKQEAILQLKNL